jgi:proton glutamate symport protein
MGRLAKLPLGLRILVGLLLGVCIGIALPAANTAPWSDSVAYIARVAGQLWLAALQMTVLPLVFALLTTGLSGSPGVSGAGGSIARRTVIVFAILYLLSLVIAVALNSFLLSIWPVSQGAVTAVQSVSASADPGEAPNAGEIIVSMVPSNLFGALAAGAMLPVVLFAILFGLAMRRVEQAQRDRVSGFIEAIAAIMFKIVEWVLLLAPLGVLGLVLATVHETGLAILWALAGYLRHLLTVIAIILLIAYPVAVLWGRVGLRKFAAAAAPSQLVALSTQSSVGSLPVMLESAKKLGVSDEVAGVTLPLAVSIFRFAGPPVTLTVAAYAAAGAGNPVGIWTLIGAAALALLMEFTGVGLPNQVNIIAINAPVFAALGAPLGFLPVMLAVETIPDAVATTGSVSMDVAATTVVDRMGAN